MGLDEQQQQQLLLVPDNIVNQSDSIAITLYVYYVNSSGKKHTHTLGDQQQPP